VPIVAWSPSDLINQTELTGNVLTVERRQSSYYLYINGQMVTTFEDTAYTKGSFGLIVDNFDQQAPVTLYFDDLIVGTPAE
jgi:hypothetical protein